MSDSSIVRSLTVVLDRDYREDELEPITDAIVMIRGVGCVRHDSEVTPDDYVNRRAIKRDVLDELISLLYIAARGGDEWEAVKKVLRDVE